MNMNEQIPKHINGGKIEIKRNVKNAKEINEAMIEAGLIEHPQQKISVHLLEKIEKNGKIIGLAGIIIRYYIIPSLFVCVAKSYRGKGYGSLLVNRVLKKKKIPVFLTVGVNNIAAQKIYKKSGFFTIMPWRKIKGEKCILMFHF